jgi:DNA polymerase (family 10)
VAKACGRRYIALTDHSKHLTIANGLDEKRLARRNEEIDEANAALKGITLLKGTEVDILKDGSLDYGDAVLASLDYVIASVHDNFHMGEQKMTERIVRAIRNPHVYCIGHLSGRLIGRRDPYPVNVTAVIEACAESGTALELNGQPDRLDARDVICREAAGAGVKISLGSDAHSASDLALMDFCVATARRGWLQKGDVLNCLTAAQLRKFLRSKNS